jgi:hypothetical protein
MSTLIELKKLATKEKNRNDLENYAYSLLVEGDLD